MARTENAAVNPVVAGRDQVLDDEWMGRMDVLWRIIGTGMTDDEVTEMTARADIRPCGPTARPSDSGPARSWARFVPRRRPQPPRTTGPRPPDSTPTLALA